MLIGYARVSTAEQNPAHQIDALVRAGVAPDDMHVDHVSGRASVASAAGSGAHAAPRRRHLVITRLDRLGRSVLHLVTLGAGLRARGVGLRVIEQGIDTSIAEGRAMFGMLSVLAELQRELIVANTRDGLAAARARGRHGERRPKLNRAQAAHAQQLYDAGGHTVAQIAALLGVARTTVYGHLNRAANESSSDAPSPRLLPGIRCIIPGNTAGPSEHEPGTGQRSRAARKAPSSRPRVVASSRPCAGPTQAR